MNNRTRISYLLACMMAAVPGYVSPAIAVSGPPDVVYELPAGVACSGFDLRIEEWYGNRGIREIKKNGVVRTISAGTGSALRYTNLNTGETLSSRSSGAVWIERKNPDGSTTNEFMGHLVLVLFPTDSPPGPSTTLYRGRVVVLIDTNGIYTVLSESGETTDICAALSQ